MSRWNRGVGGGNLLAVARSSHVDIGSSADVDQVFAAFGDEGYWQARLATFSNGTAALDALNVDADIVTVAITLHLLRDRLPKVVTQLRSGDLVMKRTERWHGTDSSMRGDITARIPGAPFSMIADAVISPTDPGSRLDYTANFEVRIPLVGGRIESYIADRAGDEVRAIHRFTGDWIAARR
jgi:hypothetical protein